MKKIHYSFFIFMKELKNELLKKNKINFSFFHKHGLHVNQEQVRVRSNETSRCTMSTRTPRICCLENSQCILCLYYSLLLSYFVLLLQSIPILAEAAIESCSPKVVSKVIPWYSYSIINSLKIVKVNLKFKQSIEK